MSDQIEFEFSLTGLSFKYKGPSHKAGQALHAGLQQSLTGLMNTPRTVMADPDDPALSPASMELPPVNGSTTHAVPGANGTNGHAPSPEKPKKPRKSGDNSPKHLIRILIGESFFKEPRSIVAVVDRLKAKGHNFTSNNLSSRLMELTQEGHLYREKTKEGYIYKDMPFDESQRPQSPSVEPTD